MTALDAPSVLAAAAPGLVEALLDARPGWVDALDRLAASAREEGGLHVAGTEAFTARLVTYARERLAAEAMLAAHPEVRSRQLPVRVVVAGLARSGTTLLHRLLACDPDTEHLATWQAFHPVPEGRVAKRDDPRRLRTLAMVDEMRRSRPEAFRVHPLDADAPEEEVFLLQLSFASMLHALTCPLPSFNEWLVSTAHHDAYRFAFDVLRLNEWAASVPEGRPRVMKSPQYVLDLQVMVDLVPGAVFVQNHRDPVDLVGSYCSVYAASRRASTEHVDLHALGSERVEHLLRMAERAAAARRGAPPGTRFVDVSYDALVRDPHGVVEQVYGAAGLQVPPAARRTIAAWLDANPQGAAGRHTYDLADYGLDRASIEERFAHLQPGAAT